MSDALDENRELTLLLLLTARKDAQAFRRLYDRTATRMLATALRILRQRSLAEEALQEGFVAIWNKAGQFDPVAGAPMAWMSTIVRNRALDEVRRRADNPQVNTDDLGEAAFGTSVSAEQTLLDLEMSEALRNCLGELEGKQRQALVLAYAHGLSHGELSAHLAQPLGTVKSWVRRGLVALKRCIDYCTGQHETA